MIQIVFFILIEFIQIISCLPRPNLTRRGDFPVPALSDTVFPETLSEDLNLTRYQRFCSAAYEDENDLSRWECDSCKNIPNIVDVQVISIPDTTTLWGQILLADPDTFLDDASFCFENPDVYKFGENEIAQSNTKHTDNALVYPGFYQGWRNFHQPILDALKIRLQRYPTYTTVSQSPDIV
ncbi:992_t:CDS:2 [Dentiscutata erythropus]|uniref:992_t:CDS:1 n=1 Tax=Dentiscutata erythropus TaxID=1348616 RepID=A0A9N9CJA9_9GLOM|nr:992_t:CDS:2 [Dentiscutata erythropus]